jgi:C_GCAxxG_C_C family probable redox protein
MSRVDFATEVMSSGIMNCAQSVLVTFCGEYGLDSKLALKLAQGFGGGMGRQGKTCGAVTGAYMAIGLQYEPDNSPEGKDRMYNLIRDFNQKFVSLHGALTCKELLGEDLSTPEGLAAVREKKLSSTLCPGFVRDAVQILEADIQERH